MAAPHHLVDHQEVVHSKLECPLAEMTRRMVVQWHPMYRLAGLGRFEVQGLSVTWLVRWNNTTQI